MDRAKNPSIGLFLSAQVEFDLFYHTFHSPDNPQKSAFGLRVVQSLVTSRFRPLYGQGQAGVGTKCSTTIVKRPTGRLRTET
jgi:hypothetical protein